MLKYLTKDNITFILGAFGSIGTLYAPAQKSQSIRQNIYFL